MWALWQMQVSINFSFSSLLVSYPSCIRRTDKKNKKNNTLHNNNNNNNNNNIRILYVRPPQILLGSPMLCTKVREIPCRDFCPWTWCNTRRCCVPYSLQCTCGCGGAEMMGRCYGRHDNCQHRTARWQRWSSGLIILCRRRRDWVQGPRMATECDPASL